MRHRARHGGAGSSSRADACWDRRVGGHGGSSRAHGSATARRCGARTCSTSSSTSPSTRSSQPRRCTGSPITIVSGDGWPGRCGRAACWRSSAVDGATSIASAKSSKRSLATALRSSSAGRPGSLRARSETERRLREAGFTAIRCWLEERPTYPEDVAAFVPTSILAAHLARLPEQRRERFAAAVVAGVSMPLDYVRLNASAVRRPI